MATENNERKEAMIRKEVALRTIAQRTREERRVKQLAANVEVRKVWLESDSIWLRQSLSGGFANAAV